MEKRKLSDFQVQEAFGMRDRNMSLGQIAKHFRTNKSQILKALHLWDSGEQTAPDGKKFVIRRGKVTILPGQEDE